MLHRIPVKIDLASDTPAPAPRVNPIEVELELKTSAIDHQLSLEAHELDQLQAAADSLEISAVLDGHALESLGLSVTTEAVGQSISKLVKAILRIAKEMWKRIADFIMAVLDDVGIVRLRVDYVRTKVHEIQGTYPKKPSVKLGLEAAGVATDFGVPSDSLRLVRSLKELLRQMDAFRTVYAPNVMALGKELYPMLRSIHKDEQALNQVNALVQRALNPYATVQRLGHMGRLMDPRFPIDASSVAPPLPGMRSIVFVDGAKVYPDANAESPVRWATALQTTQFKLTRGAITRTVDSNKTEMQTMTTSSMEEVLSVLDEILNEVEAGMSLGLRKELRHREAESEQLTTELLRHGDDGTSARLARYAAAYVQWVHNPLLPLLAHALTVVRSSLTVCNRHIAAHR